MIDQVSLLANKTYTHFSPLIVKIITYKNIKPKHNLIKNLPIHNYYRYNDKHKCSMNNENNINHCISSLRYNCFHCNNENGRSLSPVAFQKYLRIFHSNILEEMKIKLV
ncbi:hypothetical protein H8356DRAFT_1334470 [Neocallimastix lanati (nom. inval.)]|nr:hypothetical protein H8356DRAFT_1334470 [Neocallimastix sp. JGI-2020a]